MADKTSDEVRDEQRNDPAFARERFELLLPDASVRDACLRLLADSIERVHQKYGPARWGLTLRLSKKIHFNVGRLLAFGIHHGKVWIALDENALSVEVRDNLNIQGEWQERFVGIPNVATIKLPAELIPALRTTIENAYFAFLDIAGKSAVQTPYRNSHSPGAISYLRNELNRPELPEPVYNVSAPSDDNDHDDDLNEVSEIEAPSTSTRRYWKIAPGEKGRYWEENRQSGIIAIGWGQAGDPRGYSTKKALAWFLADHFGYNDQEAQANVRQLWSFIHEIKPGDIIVANRGQSKVVGRGEVLGPAQFRKDRGEYGNCLPVRWFDTTERDIPKQASWFTTVQEIRPGVYEELFGTDRNGVSTRVDDKLPARPSIYDYLQQRQLHFPAELVTTYLLSLKTKPFVILSGISGT
ncbi:MAG TPA: hypothetical protein PKA58_29185, partial [Polyangium sp.]|nr:hypothetical protein [Polyangium sp.]